MFGADPRNAGRLVATLDQLAADDPAGLADPALHDRVTTLTHALSRLQGILAATVGEWDARQLWAHDGAVSGSAWLRNRAEVDRATPLVDTARALHDHAPATAKALADGSLSYEKAAAVASAVTPEIADAFADDEASLLLAARRCTVAETRKVAAQWRNTALAALAQDPHDAARAKVDLRLWRRRDGLVGFEGFFDPDDGPHALAAIEHRANKLWHADVRQAKTAAGLADRDDNHLPDGLQLARTPGQRLSDAMLELILTGSGAQGRAHENTCIGGPSAHLHLMVPADLVIHAAAERVRRTLTVPGVDGDEKAQLEAALATLSPKHPARRLLEGPLPALDGWDTPPDAALIGLLACDCVLSRVVLDAAGVPLDVGRSQRLATPAQRRALIIRDGGCAFPGCDRPASWCDAHHIIPYELLGLTNLANLVLLCRRHHHKMHAKRPWRCWINPTTHRPQFWDPDGNLTPKHPPPATRPGAPPTAPPANPSNIQPPDRTRTPGNGRPSPEFEEVA